MATLEELVVSLVAETQGLRAELDKAAKATTNATNKMDDAIKSFTENSSKQLGFWESALASATGFLGSQAVIGAVNLLKDGVKFLADEMVKGAQDAIAEENAMTRLANSLALTGQYSKQAQTELADFTSEMERQTNVGDDVIASNLAMLSSLTKLDSEGLQNAQTAALDLSAAMGIDLNTATMLVGKGINGNTEAFKRYGFEVQAGANQTENLSNILKSLSSVQGAAAGATQTFGGLLDKNANSYGNLTEEIAKSVTQNDAYKNALSVLAGGLDQATNSVSAQDQALKIFAGETLVFLINMLTATTVTMDAVGRIGSASVAAVQMAFNGLGATITGILSLFSDDFDAAFEHFTAEAESATNAFTESFSGETLLGDVSVKLLEMRDAAEQGLGAIRAGAESTIEPTVAANEAVKELTASEALRLEQLKGFAIALAEQGAALDAQYAYEQEALKLHLENKFIAEEEYHALRNEMLIAQQEQEIAQLEAARASQQITDQQYLNAKTALERKQTLDSMKMSAERQKFEEMTNKQREANMNSTLGTIATLQSSSSKELGAIGKAAAIAQATIDGFSAVQKALAAAPPPFNFVLAGLVGAATAMNIAKIKSVSMNTGGIVPGTGPNRDSVPAMLTPGEMVVPRGDVERLSRFLDNQESGGGGGGSTRIELVMNENLVEFIEARILERQRVGTSLLVGAV